MLTFNRTRHSAAILAVALALSATGCSSARDQAALANLRSFTFSAHPTTFAVVTARHAVAVQRHAREHALTGIRTVQTLHHGTVRSL